MKPQVNVLGVFGSAKKDAQRVASMRSKPQVNDLRVFNAERELLR